MKRIDKYLAVIVIFLLGAMLLDYETGFIGLLGESEKINPDRVEMVSVEEKGLDSSIPAQAKSRQEDNASNVPATTSLSTTGSVNFNNPSWDRFNLVLSVVNLLVLFGVGFLSYKTLVSARSTVAYQKERLREKGSLLVFPEQFESDMRQLVSKVMQDLESLSKGNIQSLEISKSGASSIASALQELKEIMKIYADQLSAKELEVKRYREGYDAYLISKFSGRISSMRSAIVKDINRSELDSEKQIFQEILEFIDDSLEGVGIEPFAPEIGSNVKDAYGIDRNYKKIPTSEESQHGLIYEVLEPGLRVASTAENIDPIKEATVAVYIYQESGE